MTLGEQAAMQIALTLAATVQPNQASNIVAKFVDKRQQRRMWCVSADILNVVDP
jgi:hypothetical protein